jgi:hypothetical protein
MHCSAAGHAAAELLSMKHRWFEAGALGRIE